MFPDIVMVGGELKGKVNLHLDLLFCRQPDEPLEVRQRPEGGVYGFMAALFRPYCPGAPGVLAARAGRVVLPLSSGPADRVNGREVDNVEPHARDLRKKLLALSERALPARFTRAGAREDLIPCAEKGLLPVDHQGERPFIDGLDAPVGVSFHERREFLAHGERDRPLPIAFAERVCKGPQGLAIPLRYPLRCLFYEARTYLEINAYVLPGTEFLLEVFLPRAEAVDARLQGIMPEADLLDRKKPLPPVVGQGLHGHFVPFLFPLFPKPEDRGDLVVSVGEYVRTDDQPLTGHPLYGKGPRIDFRGDRFDDHPPSSVFPAHVVLSSLMDTAKTSGYPGDSPHAPPGDQVTLISLLFSQSP